MHCGTAAPLWLRLWHDDYLPFLPRKKGHRPALDIVTGEIVRTVDTTRSYISFKGRHWRMPQAFRGERLAIRPRAKDGLYAVCFGAYQIAEIDFNKTVSYVSEQVSTISPG